MGGRTSVIELDKFVIFVTILILIYLFRPKKQVVRATDRNNVNQTIGKPLVD